MPDGDDDADLPFLMLEIWGSAKTAARCATELAGQQKQRSTRVLVPESRCWKLDMPKITEHGASAELSTGLLIMEPMACRALQVEGTSEQMRKALACLITQISPS